MQVWTIDSVENAFDLQAIARGFGIITEAAFSELCS